MVRILFVLVWIAVQGIVTGAQVAPPATADDALRSLAVRAGVVFAGEVLDVHMDADSVVVTFRVDQVLKGPAGATYVLREWRGLWTTGAKRFCAGERAVYFLRAPARDGGFAGPVDGMDGVVALTATAGGLVADTRRLATGVQRSAGQPMALAPAMSLVRVAENVRAVSSSVAHGLPDVPKQFVSPREVAPPVWKRVAPGDIDGIR